MLFPGSGTWPRGAMRAVHCRATDPVTFALLDGDSFAEFPNALGWSAADSAHRAVTELRAWLTSPHRPPPGPIGIQPDPLKPSVETISFLLAAARAHFFLSTLEAGEPELLLTAAAIVERLDSGAATDVLAEYRRCRRERTEPAPEAVVDLRDLVSDLTSYAG